MILFSKSIFLDIETIKKLKEIKEVDLKNKFLPKEAVLNFLRQKDYNICVYLIGLFREKIEFIDNEMILEITNLFIVKECIPKKVNNLFTYILKKPLKDVSFQIFMKAASKLHLNKKDFEFIKDYFGYSQIYQYSKNILEKMLTQDYSVNEIGYALILLNHPQLCYKNLMPLFKKINEYAKYDQKNVLESGLINVCKGVQAVVLFSPETFTSRQPLLFSIFIFLNNILFYSEFYEFINLESLDLFLITNFYIMAILYLDTNNKTTLKGIFNKTLQEINTLIYKKIMIYDDFMYLYSLMYQANMLFWYVTIKEEEVNVLVNLIKELENYKIHKPKYVDNNIFKKTNTLIVKEKYNLMNNVSIIGKYNLNTSLFIDEIENIDDAQFVLSDLKAEFFNWELIIEVACKEKNQSAFFNLIFTVKDSEILLKYIESIMNSKNINLTLEILTSKKDTLLKLIDHKKILHIIFKLFLKSGSSSDIRFYQIRLISLELINQLKNEIDTSVLIDLFTFERSSEFYVLLLYVVYLTKEISEIVINEFINVSENKPKKELNYDHELELISQKAKTEDNILLKNEEIFFNIPENKTFIKNFKAQKEIELKLEEISISHTNDSKLENDNLFKNLSKEYKINIHILALMISKTQKESLFLKKENSFYFLYLKLLSYCFKKKIDKNYVQLEIELLEFLFIANEYEKRELQILFNYIKSDFLCESESIYIQTHKKIKNILYNLN